MKRKLLAGMIALATGVAVAGPWMKPVEMAAGKYPYAPVALNDVKVTGGFWLPRIETNRLVTVRTDFAKCEETGRIANFEKAGKREKGGFKGVPWDDSDVYKVIEGAAYTLAQHPDAELDRYLDGLIAKIASAQESDGYLYTARTLGHNAAMMGPKPFSRNRDACELYNVGHLYEAAVAHYEVTGKRALLDVAIKNADLVAKTFGLGEGQSRETSGHEEIEIGLCRLYQATGDKKYLKLAQHFIDMRGRKDLRPTWGAAYQDHVPVLMQKEALGHAVRAAYLYSGMADVAALAGNASYVKAIDRLWENVVGRKLHLSGGIGVRRQVKYSNPAFGSAHEAFGDDYDLQNLDCYLETCAAIGNALWNERMFLLHGDAKYIDVMERTLYNGLISGVSIGGDEFFYPNPLATKGGYKRSKWFSCSCCPVNVVRFIPQVGRFAYATKDNAAYVNLFMESEATLKLASGDVKLSQHTAYPWNGKVRIDVGLGRAGSPLPAAAVAGRPHYQCFTLNIRVPGWCVGKPVPSDLYSQVVAGTLDDFSVKVNGAPVKVLPVKGYCVIDREWKAGDVVEIAMNMPVRRIKANDKVWLDRGYSAVERGPLVYCAEGADNGGKAFFTVLPVGVTFTEGEIEIASTKMVSLKGGGLTLIPYFAWCHRGAGEMQTWFADSPTLKSSRVDAQGRFVLEFNDATSWYGYTPDNAAPGGFEIAGEDGVFHPAHVANNLVEKGRKGKMYEGRELIVASDKVKSPRRLRYLYSKPWVGSLYSGDSGLPLGPFEVGVSFASAGLPVEEWLPVTFGQTKGGTYRLDGRFLDARIYSRALSDAEAAAYSKTAAGAVSIAREGLVWEGVPTPGDRCDAVKKADYSNGFTFACRVILNKTGGRLIDNTTGGCDGWLIDTWPDRPRFYCCGKRVGDHKRQFAIGRAQSLVATLKDGKASIWLDGERCDYSFDSSMLRRTKWSDLVEKKAKPLEWIFPTGDETPQEGMRFADGVTGVLAWGGGDTIKLTVGRVDLWDHRGGYAWTKEQSYTNITDAIMKGDKARLLGLFKKVTPRGEPRNPFTLPLGRVVLKIPGATLRRGVLDVKTGIGTIDFDLDGRTCRAELAMSKESHAFAIKLPEGTKCEAKAVHCMEQPALKSALGKLSFKPAKYSANGFTWELPADESVTLAYVLKDGELSVRTWRGDRDGGHGVTALPFAQVRAESTEHWTKFWAEGARVKVPDPVVQGLFDYGMYCFGCMTDPDGVPCGLQGAWLEDNYIAPWSSDYHFNINVQECYSPAYRGGHFANMMPLFRMVLGWRERLRDNARKFADVDGYVLPHSVDDRGVNIGGFWTGTIDHGSTAWVADMMFRYVKYSRDVDFLRRDAYDFMKGAMRVYRAMMVEDGKGALAFPTGPSPEWGGATFETAVGRNPSFQLAAAHRLARNLIAAAAMLGETPDPMWLDVEKRLPLAAIDNEKGGIMLFENRPFSASHRHHSHLAGLFPFDIFDLDDPATATNVKKTYETWDMRGTSAWTGWCVPWAAVLNVHAGRAEQAVKLLHDFDEYFTNPGHAPRCFAWKPGFCQFVSSTPKLGKDRRHLGQEVLDMDGLLSACAAVMEMMAHEVNGKTEFFKGCPPEWKEVSFENLALSDGRRVSGRRINGKVDLAE